MKDLDPTLMAFIIFTCLFASALLGLRLRAWLPKHHLSEQTKDAVQIGMGSVATMAALVLGLLVASTKEAYDAEKHEVIEMSAKVIHLDRLLVNYGPAAAETRSVLRNALRSAIIRIWPEVTPDGEVIDPGNHWSEAVPKAIQRLSPQDDAQRTFKSQAALLANELGQMRWLLFEQTESTISLPLLGMMVFWLALTFVSVGVFAPPNATVLVAQLLAAFSVSGAIFLILELDRPFSGLVRISNAPMVNALKHLAK
jgi:hypothetical protein